MPRNSDFAHDVLLVVTRPNDNRHEVGGGLSSFCETAALTYNRVCDPPMIAEPISAR